MEIVSEAIELVEADVPEPEPPTPEPKRRARAESKAAKPRVRKPAVAEVVEVAPEPAVEPTTAPKARARKPTAAPPAPTAPGISDVLGMLASALLDQRQARSSQRQAMYSRFLD